jgi:hypothetical protein
MDRLINTITATVSTFAGNVSRGIVVVGLAILPERLRLHARSLGMRHLGATCEGTYTAGLLGIKRTLMPATAWKQPGQSSRRVSQADWRSAWRRWCDGSRADF